MNERAGSKGEHPERREGEAGCGGCTMCCKVRGVHELRKWPWIWCPHCEVGKGCTVYDERPASCAEYVCLWFAHEQEADPDLHLEPALRPDRCKVVMEHPGGAGKLFFYVDPARIGNWRSRPVDLAIKKIEAAGDVVSVTTRGSRLLYASPNVIVEFPSVEEELRRLESKG